MTNTKTCHGCGKQFKPNFRTQRYCSRSCWGTSAENRELMLERWHDPEFRALVSEMTRERWRDDPEFRALISEMSRERWHDPEFRALVTEMTREQWQKPEIRVLMIEALKAARRKRAELKQ